MILKRFTQKDSGKYDRVREFAGKKCISELQSTIDYYMKNTINGDLLGDEQEFEDAVRNVLKANGFIVQEKQNVENAINELNEKNFSEEIEKKIPDITVECREGLVFLELKFKNTDAMYSEDMRKVQNYRVEKKDTAAGVLFLDKERRYAWKRCIANSSYYYYWNLR